MNLLGRPLVIAIGAAFFAAIATFELTTGQASSAAFSALIAVFLLVVALGVHRRGPGDDD